MRARELFLLKTELDEYQNLPDVRLAGCSINPQETSDKEERGGGSARLAGTKHGEGRAAPMSRGAGQVAAGCRPTRTRLGMPRGMLGRSHQGRGSRRAGLGDVFAA